MSKNSFITTSRFVFYLLSLVIFSYLLWRLIIIMPGSFNNLLLLDSNQTINDSKPTYLTWLKSFILLDWGFSSTYRTSVLSVALSSLIFSFSFSLAVFALAVPLVIASSYLFYSSTLWQKISLFLLAVPSLVLVLFLNLFSYYSGIENRLLIAYIVAFNASFFVLASYLNTLIKQSESKPYATLGKLLNLSSTIFYKKWLLKPIMSQFMMIVSQNFARFLGSMLVIETAFNLPGLSNSLYQAILGRDYNLIMVLNIIIFLSIIVLQGLGEFLAKVVWAKYDQVS